MKTVLLIHGPNLNLLGQREPDVYGAATLSEHIKTTQDALAKQGASLQSLQSNSEAQIVDAIHEARGSVDAIIINPGAFTHYSWAIHDALKSFSGPIVEVHLSNPAARETFRHTSVVAPVAIGTIAGFGGHGYELAVQALFRHGQ
ncbi:MAG: type II 3-dehydroquinate dehydratase [Ilumatobacteraceae bacterium]|nr:type II 3-dehydroquinate dehydratase [Ilumatobacteraceae bacterium]